MRHDHALKMRRATEVLGSLGSVLFVGIFASGLGAPRTFRLRSYSEMKKDSGLWPLRFFLELGQVRQQFRAVL